MVESTEHAGRTVEQGYSHGENRPLRGYLVTLGTYGAAVTSLIAAARKKGRRLPERVPTADIVLLCIATHKVSRLLAKDTVTSPLRAPFTEFEGPTGHSEVKEQVRGEGTRHAVGELVSCPFCLAVWVATGLAAGLVFVPRLTRLVAATFTAVAVSDFLQIAYDRAKSAH